MHSLFNNWKSNNFLQAILATVFQKVTENVSEAAVKGIGFDATCSLVVLDENFQPVAVNDDSKFADLFVQNNHLFAITDILIGSV